MDKVQKHNSFNGKANLTLVHMSQCDYEYIQKRIVVQKTGTQRKI